MNYLTALEGEDGRGGTRLHPYRLPALLAPTQARVSELPQWALLVAHSERRGGKQLSSRRAGLSCEPCVGGLELSS
jgi:hypothetical protein